MRCTSRETLLAGEPTKLHLASVKATNVVELLLVRQLASKFTKQQHNLFLLKLTSFAEVVKEDHHVSFGRSRLRKPCHRLARNKQSRFEK